MGQITFVLREGFPYWRTQRVALLKYDMRDCIEKGSLITGKVSGHKLASLVKTLLLLLAKPRQAKPPLRFASLSPCGWPWSYPFLVELRNILVHGLPLLLKQRAQGCCTNWLFQGIAQFDYYKVLHKGSITRCCTKGLLQGDSTPGSSITQRGQFG